MLYKWALLLSFLISSNLFSQDTIGKKAMPWDFLKGKEKRTWCIHAGVVIPVGLLTGYAHQSTEVSGYFFKYDSKIQQPVHFFIGESINFTRKRVRSRTKNGKISIASLLSPLNMVVIHYDFETIIGKRPTIKSALNPFIQYGFSGGYELDYSINKKLSSAISLSTAVFGESFSGRIKFAELKSVIGFTVSNVSYNYVGFGTLLNGGWHFQFLRLKAGISYSSTISTGKYFTSNQIVSNGNGYGTITHAEPVKVYAQYLQLYIGYKFGKKVK